jgi:hypothetical protein
VCLALAALLLAGGSARAQHDHVDVYSSEPGGGALVLDWDFDKRIQVFETFCAAGLCLYGTINPALLAPEEDDAERGLYALEDGTRVSIEIVAADAALTLNVDGVRLRGPGDSALLGTMPNIHNHPSWQLVVPEGTVGEYAISYKVRADSGYADSQVAASLVSNVPQAVEVPCPASPCPGDCDDDGETRAAEIADAVEIALAGASVAGCPSMDRNADGVITIDEMVDAVDVHVRGCPERLPATLLGVQGFVFASCAIPTCHDSVSATGNLVLAAGVAHGELVGVAPDVAAARDAGLLRVVPGDPDSSFLYRKLVGPRPEWGSRMPLDAECLLPEQLDQVRRWILAGAPD